MSGSLAVRNSLPGEGTIWLGFSSLLVWYSRKNDALSYLEICNLPHLRVVQRVMSLSMLKSDITPADIVGEVNRIVVNKFGLDEDKCRGITLDGCATNVSALSTLKMIFPNAVGL